VLGVLAWMGVTALPLSIGVAILRYRLYEIDRIISRTLAYAIVTGLLIGVYAGLVLLATEVLRFSSPVAVAASTLVAAALFNPVRRRVQHAVDRRFNRARYDAEQMVNEFAARLQDAVDSDSVRAAGRAIAHSEESAAGRPAALHGLQLWIALPEPDRFTEPRFAHHADLPVLYEGRARVTVVIGEYRGEQSPAEVFTPLAGLEVAVPGGDDLVLPVREDFEYAVVAVDGSAVVAGALIAPGLLAHLPAGLSEIRLSPAGGRRHARFFVLGGVPFAERLLMWWNFVGRSGEEIARAREDWVAGRFGDVRGYPGKPLAAPPLPTVPLKPR